MGCGVTGVLKVGKLEYNLEDGNTMTAWLTIEEALSSLRGTEIDEEWMREEDGASEEVIEAFKKAYDTINVIGN